MHPALRLPLLLAAGIAQRVLRIVRLEQVLDDGAALPQREARVRVLERRHAAVGVQLFERGRLQLGELLHFGFVGEVQFVEDDGDLPRVGALVEEKMVC